MVQAIDDARRRNQAANRVPPHNLMAEQSLLGAMLLSRDAIAAAVETVSADDFYKPAHAHIFDAVLSLYSKGEPVDPVTVADELRRNGLLESVGESSVLMGLQINTPSTGNAAHYARIVEEHSLLRRLVAVAGDIADLGYSVPDDVMGVVDQAESMVFEVAQRRVVDSTSPIRDLLAQALDHLEQVVDAPGSVTGVPTGYADLDSQLAGLQKANLVVVGARPSMGKTSFALGMVSHAAVHARVPVLLFSLEMSHLHEADWPRISSAIGRLGEAPIFIDDNPRVTVMDIRAKARRLKSREGLGLVVIDYLQLMTGHSGRTENRQVEVSEISRGLKVLARELDVPVIALSQLSRNLARSNRTPTWCSSSTATRSTTRSHPTAARPRSWWPSTETGRRESPSWPSCRTSPASGTSPGSDRPGPTAVSRRSVRAAAPRWHCPSSRWL
jgi:replicative DNA helicase